MQLLTIVCVVVLATTVSCFPYYEDEHIFLADPQSSNDYVPLTYRAKRENSVSVGAGHSRDHGTSVNVDAQGRVWTSKDRQSQVDDSANYNQHFGGQGPRRDYGAEIRYQHNF